MRRSSGRLAEVVCMCVLGQMCMLIMRPVIIATSVMRTGAELRLNGLRGNCTALLLLASRETNTPPANCNHFAVHNR
jgi:hypothetical protein